jgi:hypothetical protein
LLWVLFCFLLLLFLFLFWWWGLSNYLPGLALNHNPDLSLPSKITGTNHCGLLSQELCLNVTLSSFVHYWFRSIVLQQILDIMHFTPKYRISEECGIFLHSHDILII